MSDKLHEALVRWNDYKNQIRRLPEGESLQIFALAAMIKSIIDRNPKFGLPAMTLVSCEVAFELQESRFKQVKAD